MLSCRHDATPAQVVAVDSMLTNVEAAILTLNELDKGRYTRAAALYRSDAPRYQQRFRDTLDRSTALLLGNHFRVLLAAGSMGSDHDSVLLELASAKARLTALRTDLVNGGMDEPHAGPSIATEREYADSLAHVVNVVITNYRTVQAAWDELDTVDVLLAGNNDRERGDLR